MSLTRDLIQKAIETRNGDMMKQVLMIHFPDNNYSKYLIMEYDGDVPRLFGDKRSIELMLPMNMDVVTENAVVDAIESGTLFEDKKNIENNVDYIAMTHLPKLGMMHKHIEEPHALVYAIGTVMGAMDHDGRFGKHDSDIKNAKSYTMDLTQHGDEKDTSVMDLTSDYLDIKDKMGKGVPVELRRSLAKVPDEVSDIKKVKAEDTVDEDDYEEIGLDHDEEDEECHDSECDEECEDCDDNEEDDQDIDVEKEEAIERFLKSRKKDIDFSKEAADLKATIVTNPGASNMTTTSVPVSTSSSFKSNSFTSNTANIPKPVVAKSSYNNPATNLKSNFKTESYREYDEYEMYQETNAILMKPKQLKPIGRDIIAYVMTQKNNIHDANDQSMLASYCCAKLELVDFYLNCIDTKDYRYIVPHNRQYLVQMQNDLNRCLQEVLRVRPVNRMDRAWRVNVVYPQGWGG